MTVRRAITISGVLAAGLSLASCAENDRVHTEDSLRTVEQKIAAGEAVLVDVREKSEWDEGHVAGAIFLPLSELSRDGSAKALAAARLTKDKIVYTHCRRGVRSVSAGEILEGLGYQVRPLEPGYEELVAAGFEKAAE